MTRTKSFKSILLFLIFEERKTIVPFSHIFSGLYVKPIFVVPIEDNLVHDQFFGISKGISEVIFLTSLPFFS